MRQSVKLLEMHADQPSKLSLSVFTKKSDSSDEEKSDAQTFVLIKANPESLRFLGEFLIRFAEGDEGRSFFMHPDGPGSSHFSADSRIGIYLEDARTE